jgi:UDP-N-acetylglucosamine diphosphorylase/glucosamine-1-phosphate N-acetyltransferase
VKAGAKIYGKTSVGESCKFGGEIENAIIHAYSNKQHEGFLGHSYIGEWVNLGADTNTSDLKNTYANIKVTLEGREIDTEKMFLGLLCGDHTKSAINTSFTTGTVAGVCGILVHDGTLPAVIPSYAWTGRKNSPIYKIDKALDVARIVMARRGKELLPEEELLLRQEYEKVSKV